MSERTSDGARDGRESPGADEANEPADALGDVWNLLDVLPRAAASPSMTATTIEMAAVEVERSVGSMAAVPPVGVGPQGSAASPRGWPLGRRLLGAAAVVAGSLAAGIVAGRATAPNIDSRRGFEYLPVVRNVDLLREAGSVGFLEAVATRRFPPPRRPSLPRSAADMRRFDAAIAALRSFRADAPGGPERLLGLRAEVAAMNDADRRELERSMATFARLTAAERQDLVRLAEAFGDPRRGDLVDAARLWHLWVASCDPADRRDIVDLQSRDRLEWLERQTRIERRMDERLEGRPPRGWWDRERPPPGPDERDRDWPPPGPPHGPPRHGPPPSGPPPFGPPGLGPPDFGGPAGSERFEGPPRRRPPDRAAPPGDGTRQPPDAAAGDAR